MSDVRPVDDVTDPVGEPEAANASTDPAGHGEAKDAPTHAPQPKGTHTELVEAAGEEEDRRSFFARIGGRRVVIPLACVAAFLVGFGSVTVVLWLTDVQAQPNTKPAPATSPPTSAPAITTPPTSAAQAVAGEATPPPPEPVPAPAPAPAPQTTGSESPAPPSSVPPSSSPQTTTGRTTPSTTTAP